MPSSNTSLIVKCEGIEKSFVTPEVTTYALRGINLSVEEGSFTMLVGPSGCGKTTLISIIAGILHGETGDCTVLDQTFSKMSPEEILAFRSRYIGFIFQSFNLIPTLSVIENVSIPLFIKGYARKAALEQGYHFLEEVGLSEKAFALPNLLSGGQQQRVAIARSLVHQPKIVICDEPTSALDQDTGLKVMDLMKSINQKLKTTFIVVTHDGRIFKYADSIAHMNDGRIDHISRGIDALSHP